MKRRIIEFKSVSPLFEMEKAGEKPFTTRKIEAGDKRFLYLGALISSRQPYSYIKITNIASGETFERRIKAVELLSKCPWWMIIYWEHKED